MTRKTLSVRGDTIVEVMLAMATLAFVLLIAWGMTNRSTQIMLNSQKRLTMVNQMKEQAEIIKALYSEGNGLPLSSAATAPGNVPSTSNPCSASDITNGATNPTGAFYFTAAAGTGATRVNESKKATGTQPPFKLWIEKHVIGTEYTDYFIRSCWQTVGGRQTQDSSQFVVRLNQ